MAVSTFAYILGVLGGFGGLLSMMESLMLSAEIGILLLVASIAVLWAGVLIESVEESYNLF